MVQNKVIYIFYYSVNTPKILVILYRITEASDVLFPFIPKEKTFPIVVYGDDISPFVSYSNRTK